MLRILVSFACSIVVPVRFCPATKRRPQFVHTWPLRQRSGFELLTDPDCLEMRRPYPPHS